MENTQDKETASSQTQGANLRRDEVAGTPTSRDKLVTSQPHWFKPMLLLLGLFALVFLITAVAVDYWRAHPKTTETIDSLTSGSSSQASVGNVNVNARSTIANLETSDDPTLGPTQSNVVVVAFIDFECTYCKEMYQSFRELTTEYGSKVKFIFRNFPLTEIHDHAEAAAEAARCAYQQGNDKFWAYHDKLFQNQDDLSDTALLTYGEEIGLDQATFKECVKSKATASAVEADLEDGVAEGVTGTPTFFFNGKKVQGVISKEKFAKALDLLLKQ